MHAQTDIFFKYKYTHTCIHNAQIRKEVSRGIVTLQLRPIWGRIIGKKRVCK